MSQKQDPVRRSHILSTAEQAKTKQAPEHSKQNPKRKLTCMAKNSTDHAVGLEARTWPVSGETAGNQRSLFRTAAAATSHARGARETDPQTHTPP